MDGETDALIQSTLRRTFADATVVTIAHRLGTIIDCDAVLVLEAGRLVEAGAPSELIDARGAFASMVDETGPGQAKLLRAAARRAAVRIAGGRGGAGAGAAVGADATVRVL